MGDKSTIPYNSPMKHPPELATAIEEARRQARSAYETNDTSMSRSGRQIG